MSPQLLDEDSVLFFRWSPWLLLGWSPRNSQLVLTEEKGLMLTESIKQWSKQGPTGKCLALHVAPLGWYLCISVSNTVWFVWELAVVFPWGCQRGECYENGRWKRWDELLPIRLLTCGCFYIVFLIIFTFGRPSILYYYKVTCRRCEFGWKVPPSRDKRGCQSGLNLEE